MPRGAGGGPRPLAAQANPLDAFLGYTLSAAEPLEATQRQNDPEPAAMPTLDWIGKRAVVNHHQQVPTRLLRCDPASSAGNPDTGNLIVQGDNLNALKALLPHYAGKVKCIYIDPPYNTGNEGWIYNDNVNAPEIKAWLGKAVGKEAEDLSRHDKWLCMMYPRLKLLREFLTEDGLIFVSIDEEEVANVQLMLDEIFGRRNRLGTFVWKRRSSSAMRGMPLSIDHEYVAAFANNKSAAVFHGLEKGIAGYPFKDEQGNFASTDLTVGRDAEARPGQFFTITNPRTGVEYPPNPNRVWRFYGPTMAEVIDADLVIWPDEHPDRNLSRPRYKTYFDPKTEKVKPVSTWIESSSKSAAELEADAEDTDLEILQSGMTQDGGKLLRKLFGSTVFDYSKPISLIESLLRAGTRNDDLILDSFAGSGTTLHAAMQLNREDGGNRRCILVEMEENIATEVTAERIRRVMKQDDAREDEGFRFCTLGEPLFGADGTINEKVTYRDLAHHVFFTETGRPLPKGAKGPELGTNDDRRIFLLFNGVMGDRSTDGGNLLNRATLGACGGENTGSGPRTVYAEGCRLSDATLQRLGITFKQLPYDVKAS